MTHILVIEDSSKLRERIIELLGYEDFEVVGAPNGRVGVQLAREKLPDLIICDVMMPELDGYGVLLELRSEPITATIPFIFLTALAERSDLRRGMEHGADDYLTKPFTQPELLAAVNVALEKQQIKKRLYGQQLEELRQNLLQSLPHELRTPLNAILGYGQLLALQANTVEPDKIRSMAENIVTSGRRLFRLIENYLLYAQLELMKADPERVNMLRNVRIENALEVIRYSAEQQARDVGREGDLILDMEQVVSVAVSEDSLPEKDCPGVSSQRL
jgi:two-component system, sensor histidine kinase and response regulator